ncbi:hypothetical protein [Nostoc sp.]|uniref:hypothetical protein n=1 Tax=Nostoc sp. TaxID=1180 RepID=UPI002FF5A1A5
MGTWRTSILPVTALAIRAVRYSFNSSIASLILDFFWSKCLAIASLMTGDSR